MAVDVDILKTLENIEALLEGASVLARGKTPSASQQKNQQSQKQKADKEVTKAFKAVASVSSETKDTVLGLNKSLTGLNAEIGRTTSGFGSLNAQITRFTSSLEPVQTPEAQEMDASGFDQLSAAAIKASTLVNQFGTTVSHVANQVQVTSNAFAQSAQQIANTANSFVAAMTGAQANMGQSVSGATTPLAAFIGALSGAVVAPNPNQQTAAAIQQQLQGLGNAAQGSTQAIQNMHLPWQMVIGRMVNTTTIGFGTLAHALDNFGEVIKKLTGDFIALSGAGMGSWGNLATLSKNALLSGMSLKEYTETIKENITFASRAGTLENFDKITKASDDQLSAMGIFGKQAKVLQASLANSATSMGVPQSQLIATIAGQIDVFDKLRRSTNMTAEEFGELVKGISKQEGVQRELIGLAPTERAARQQQLLQLQTAGQRLGLVADESKALADALMKQRGETVKSRFEQASRVRQLAAFAGRGAEGERAAQIIMKGRAASIAELEELRTIAGSLDATTQSIYENGSFGAQNVIDVLGETLNGKAFGDLMKANRPAELADIAKVNQEAFGKHVDKFGELIGGALKYIRGFNESVLPALLASVGGALAFAFRAPLTKMLQGALGGVTGAGRAGAATGTIAASTGVGAALKAPFIAAQQGIMSLGQSAMGFFKNIGTGFQAASQGGTGFLNFLRGLGGGVGSAIKGIISGGSALLNGISGVVRGLGPVTALVSGVIEAFTGELANAMDPNGGIWSRIGGVAISVLAAVPQLIIDALTWVFGDEFMKPIQSVFDTLKTGVMLMINTVALGLTNAVSWLTDLLPDDSGLKKMVNSAKDSLAGSVEANLNTLNKLGGVFGSENRKTLKELSAENTKAAEASQKESAAAGAKVQEAQKKFNNVQYGVAVTKASMVADAQAILGTPQVQTQKAIAPATVNTPESAAPAPTVAPTGTSQAAPQTDMMAVLNAILQVLRDSLSEEQKQALLAEQLLARSRPSASFTPSEVTANRLLKQGLVPA